MMDEKCGYKTPTPADSLEQQIIDPSFPKNEREWWAAEEITRLRAEVASLTAQLQSGESFHTVTVRQRDAAWREVETLKATLTQQCKGFRADVEKLETEAEALRNPVARPRAEWHEDMGDVLWWRLPVDEPPYCGQPGDSDWTGYHTHWTPLVVPSNAAQGKRG